ncbi:site-specific integrase [Escherichia coli]|uniref:site-specific integrase n=1 Tax=Escherichia coli TaxID=562 RepID=UPI0013B3DB90|nr:site-specific integrase [Escherichia coli]
MENNQEVYKFEENRIVVQRRARSRFWQARYLLPDTKRYIWESLKTTDVHEAITKAKRAYFRLLVKQEEGLPIFQKKFVDAAASYVKEQEGLVALGKQSKHMFKATKGALDRYLVPYFGKMDVSDIKEKTGKEFYTWRLTAGKSGKTPGPSILLQEFMALNMVMKHCVDNGWLTNAQLPKLAVPSGELQAGGVRPGFSKAEYKLLTERMEKWAGEATEQKNKYTRELLRHMVLIVTATGMRTNDVHLFRWRDIEYRDIDGDQHVVVYLRGKGIPAKWCVAQPEAREHFESWRKLCVRTGPDDLLFATTAGGKFQYSVSLKKMFEECGMLKDAEGKERTLYSCRHTSAMMRLLDGVSVFDLAKNMRTSVKVIEAHYGSHISALQRANEITEGTKNAKGIKFTPTMELQKNIPGGDIALTVVKKAPCKSPP